MEINNLNRWREAVDYGLMLLIGKNINDYSYYSKIDFNMLISLYDRCVEESNKKDAEIIKNIIIKMFKK